MNTERNNDFPEELTLAQIKQFEIAVRQRDLHTNHGIELGQQIMAVRIIRTGIERTYPRIEIEDIAEWMECKIEDVELIKDCFYKLNQKELGIEAAKLVTNNYKDYEYMFNLFIVDRYGMRYIQDLICNEEILWEEWIDMIKKDYNTDYSDFKLNPVYFTTTHIAHVLNTYLDYFVNVVNKIVNTRLDWRVIQEMLPFALTQEEFNKLKVIGV